MSGKILTSPSSFGQISEEPFEILRQNGFEVINNPFGRRMTSKEVMEVAPDVVGIVAGVEPLNKEVMDTLVNLKCISRVGVGMDSVDLEYAKEKNITVVNTPNGPTRAVAELALGMTLSLLRKIPQAHASMKQNVWKKQIGNLFLDKKIGIVGLGRIGRMTAELFRALGNTVIGYDLYPNEAWAQNNNVALLSLNDVLATADIVSLHVPGNKDKSPIITRTDLEKMKAGSFLVNLSRGGVVEENALYELLSNNHLAGAAIDVFSKEPYSGPLTTLDNVVLTPHLGSYAKEGKLKMEIDAVYNLVETLKTT